MKRRHKNEARLSTGAKVAIASAVGLVAGGVASWWIASTTAGSVAADNALDVVDDLRLPQPGMKMMLPETIEEFETIDEVICEIGEDLIANAPPGTTAEEVTEQIRDHVLRELYPEFPWPPISGDNPTVAQLWTEVSVLVRRAVVTGNVCPAEAT